LEYEVTANSLVGAGTLWTGIVSSNEAFNTIELVATVGTHRKAIVASRTGNRDRVGFQIKADTTSGSIAIDNAKIYAFNIAENLAPNLENITEFANGSLQQPASGGQNHIINDGAMLTKFTHNIGVSGFAKSTRESLEMKADITDLTPTYPLAITSTGGVAGDSITIVEFSDIAGFPDYLENIDASDVTLDTNIDNVTFYPNCVVITADATGTGAGDELFSATVKAGMPEIKHTVA